MNPMNLTGRLTTTVTRSLIQNKNPILLNQKVLDRPTSLEYAFSALERVLKYQPQNTNIKRSIPGVVDFYPVGESRKISYDDRCFAIYIEQKSQKALPFKNGILLNNIDSKWGLAGGDIMPNKELWTKLYETISHLLDLRNFNS